MNNINKEKIMPCAHYKLMKEYLKDCEKYERPWEMWQRFSSLYEVWVDLIEHPEWLSAVKYRRRPRTITIPESELPEPMREAPEVGSHYFAWKKPGLSVIEYRWDGNSPDRARLDACLSFHTEQDAIAWRDWWRENVMGRE